MTLFSVQGFYVKFPKTPYEKRKSDLLSTQLLAALPFSSESKLPVTSPPSPCRALLARVQGRTN